MRPNQQSGFTLIEIVVGLLMSSIIMAAIYTTSKKQQDVYVTQDLVIGTQNNLRSAMLLMSREIRMAGYDPTGNAGATITAATSNSLTFTTDVNVDGNIVNSDGTTDVDEQKTYSLYVDADNINKLGRKNPDLNKPVAENIMKLEFYYTMADGSKTLAPAVLADIRAVQITILARTANTIGTPTNTPTMLTPGAQSWPMPNNYLWRSESTTIQFRNMGL